MLRPQLLPPQRDRSRSRPAATSDGHHRLSRLAELRSQGLLNDDEFEAAKAQVLAA